MREDAPTALEVLAALEEHPNLLVELAELLDRHPDAIDRAAALSEMRRSIQIRTYEQEVRTSSRPFVMKRFELSLFGELAFDVGSLRVWTQDGWKPMPWRPPELRRDW